MSLDAFEPNDREWALAEEELKDQPNGAKFDKYINHDNKSEGLRTRYSFVKVDDQIYALSNKTCFETLEGSFGNVKQGKKRGDPELYAIKVEPTTLRDELSDAYQASQKSGLVIGQAARSAEKFRHKTDFQEEKITSKLYTVMKWAGEDLEVSFDKNKTTLSDTQKLLICLKSCVALEAAHQQGIVHRDIKSQNITMIINPQDSLDIKLRLIDLDDAKILAKRQEQVIRDEKIVGTQGYRAPEVMTPDPHGRPYSPASDTYSLAVMFLILNALPTKVNVPKEVIDEYISFNSSVPLAKYLNENGINIESDSFSPEFGKILKGMLDPAPKERATLIDMIIVLCDVLKDKEEIKQNPTLLDDIKALGENAQKEKIKRESKEETNVLLNASTRAYCESIHMGEINAFADSLNELDKTPEADQDRKILEIYETHIKNVEESPEEMFSETAQFSQSKLNLTDDKTSGIIESLNKLKPYVEKMQSGTLNKEERQSVISAYNQLYETYLIDVHRGNLTQSHSNQYDILRNKYPLHAIAAQTDFSATSENQKLLDALLNNININGKNEDGKTALDITIEKNNTVLKDKLINMRNSDGKTALENAVELDDVELIQKLRSNGADINLLDSKGKTAFKLVFDADDDIAEIERRMSALIKAGININLKNSKGETALEIAMKNDRPMTRDKLIENRADINIPFTNGKTPLQIACEESNTALMNKLIEAGANPLATSTNYDRNQATRMLDTIGGLFTGKGVSRWNKPPERTIREIENIAGKTEIANILKQAERNPKPIIPEETHQQNINDHPSESEPVPQTPSNNSGLEESVINLEKMKFDKVLELFNKLDKNNSEMVNKFNLAREKILYAKTSEEIENEINRLNAELAKGKQCLEAAKHCFNEKDYEQLVNTIQLSLFHTKAGAHGVLGYRLDKLDKKDLILFGTIIKQAADNAKDPLRAPLIEQQKAFETYLENSKNKDVLEKLNAHEKDIDVDKPTHFDLSMFKHEVGKMKEQTKASAKAEQAVIESHGDSEDNIVKHNLK